MSGTLASCATFSGSVICAISRSTRCSVDNEELSHGREVSLAFIFNSPLEDDGYPLSAPAMMPLTSCSWKMM